ncbi:MAG: hypothetical protein U5L02_06830 [Rheinheimera sp.]|nr:hypothetical protein [Rheinheimera sp.]
MPQPDQVTSPFYAESHTNLQQDDFVLQPDYFHGELNAGEDGVEWQEFALLQLPGSGG